MDSTTPGQASDNDVEELTGCRHLGPVPDGSRKALAVRYYEADRIRPFIDSERPVSRSYGGYIQAWLDRDLTVETRIVCQVDLTHSAAAERLKDFVAAELCSRVQSHLMNRTGPEMRHPRASPFQVPVPQ